MCTLFNRQYQCQQEIEGKCKKADISFQYVFEIEGYNNGVTKRISSLFYSIISFTFLYTFVSVVKVIILGYINIVTISLFSHILSLNLRLKCHWNGRVRWKLYEGISETCLLEQIYRSFNTCNYLLNKLHCCLNWSSSKSVSNQDLKR